MFCGKCGERLGTKEIPIDKVDIATGDKPTDTIKKGNNDLLLKIIGVVILVGFIGIVIFNYYKDKNSVENRIFGQWYKYDYYEDDYSHMDYMFFGSDGIMDYAVENYNKPTDGSMSVASIGFDGEYWVDEESETVSGYVEGIGYIDIYFMEEYEDSYLVNTYYDVIVAWVDGIQEIYVKPK